MSKQAGPRRPGGPVRLPLKLLEDFRSYGGDQKLFILESMLINSANVITGGVFLTGLMLYMGATDFIVGLISSSGAWALMLSLASSVVMESVRRKKALLAWVLLAFRMLTALPVFLPAILGRGMPTALAAASMIIAGNLIFSIFNTGFFVFYMDSLPKEGRVNFIYARMFYLRIAYTVFLVGMGILLDLLNRSYAGFVAVFSTGLLIGLLDVLVLTRIRGSENPAGPGGGPLLRLGPRGFTRKLLEPLRNRRYLRYLLFTFALFFFQSMSSSYTSLYQYKYLNLSVSFISVYTACIYVVMILVTRKWAALEQRVGSLKVLAASSLLMSLDFLVYGFLTQRSLWVIALSPIFQGLGASGYWACALPYRYDLMPAEGKTVYEGWNGLFFGAASLLGALAGGKLQLALPRFATGFFSVFQLVYLMSFILAAASVAVFWMLARRD